MTAYRTATRSELALVLDWAAAEGWNPGLDDGQAFYAADPHGFFVAEHEGAPVAAISVVNHNDSFAFLGLYITRPEFRGRSIGYGLWQYALDHAGARTIGLDGVPAQQANYAASGFRATGTTTRFSGRVAPATGPVTLAGAGDIPDLINREAEISGSRKTAYLTAWFTETEHRKTLIAGEGFCTVRKCRSGAKVGPLIAPDGTTAETLLGQAAALMGPDLILDVSAEAPELAGLCRNQGWEAGFETARMYRGPAPRPRPGIFAVTSLELG